MTLVVGLTGGIGSGKTAVSDRFAALGVPVIDTDLLSREVVKPGHSGLEEIASAFGREMIAPDGTLDRNRLRQRVFRNPAERERLERILHPRIREAMLARLAQINAPYVMVVIPLLFESRQTDVVDRVLVVDAPEAAQRQRVADRDGLADKEVAQVLAAQTDRAKRLRGADDVIHNDRTLTDLDQVVSELHQRYLSWAGVP